MSGSHQPVRGFRRLLIQRGWMAALMLASLSGFAGSCLAQTPANDVVISPSTDALARTRKYVQEYFERFSDLICKESVTQLVLNGSGRTIYRENSAYDYQFQSSDQTGSWKFNEIRVSRSPAFRDPARTLLVTTGFASLLLVAHPMYESSYVFAQDGEEAIEGMSYLKIHFTPISGAPSPATLRLRGRNYPLPLSGTLWIDPRSGAVVKLEATVDSGLSDIGLAGMHSEVHFALHPFHDRDDSVWVPETAVIDVATPRQHWRNLHHFTAYKKFDVNVQEQIGETP